MMLLSAVTLGESTLSAKAQAQSGEVALPPIPAEGTVALGDIKAFPSAADVGSFNPAKELLDKRKRLQLTELQVTALRDLQTTLTTRNEDQVKRYETAYRLHKSVESAGFPGMVKGQIVSVTRIGGSGQASMPTASSGPPPSPGGAARGTVIVTAPMRIMWDASQELMVRHNKDVMDAASVLEATQADEGMALLDKQTREMLKKLPQPPTRN
ncbi:MAG: hypothetical protein V4617_10840 [Gemmatimonadota bacterium]